MRKVSIPKWVYLCWIAATELNASRARLNILSQSFIFRIQAIYLRLSYLSELRIFFNGSIMVLHLTIINVYLEQTFNTGSSGTIGIQSRLFVYHETGPYPED